MYLRMSQSAVDFVVRCERLCNLIVIIKVFFVIILFVNVGLCMQGFFLDAGAVHLRVSNLRMAHHGRLAIASF